MPSRQDASTVDHSRMDPYLAWAQCTGFRHYTAGVADARIAVAIECREGVRALRRELRRAGLQEKVFVSSLYAGLFASGDAGAADTSFCTATLRPSDLDDLLPLVRRLELGTAINVDQRLDPARAARRRRVPTSPDWAPGVVVGVIDDFVPFAHPRFAVAGESRVGYVWSQDPKPPRLTKPAQWHASGLVGYGYELTSLATRADGASTLSSLHDAYPVPLPRSSHGAHVADMAAANRWFPTTAARQELPAIIAVHLPARTLADTSGGALNVQALDGLRYILHRAGETASIVVNLSYATLGGPHDGSSILECAIDELIDRRKGKLAVVVPAGNAYEARCHARVRLDAARPSRRLHWRVPPDCSAPAFMEVWLPPGGAGRIGIEVRNPRGVTLRVCDPCGPCFETTDPATASFGVIYGPQVTNGLTGTMILVAVSPTTSAAPDAVLASHGVWEVELFDQQTGPLDDIRVWVERDDTAHGQPRRGRQSCLLDSQYRETGDRPGPAPADNPAAAVQRHGALNTIATGANTIVVGGCVADTRETAIYSGGGPGRGTRDGPDLVAPAEESASLHGLRAAAVEGVDTVRMNGTSVAVPQITRRIARMFLRAPPGPGRALSPTDIRAALRAESARHRDGKAPPDKSRGEDMVILDEPYQRAGNGRSSSRPPSRVRRR